MYFSLLKTEKIAKRVDFRKFLGLIWDLALKRVSKFVIPEFRDTLLVPKITKCGDLLYVLYYSFLPTIYRFGVCCLFIVSATSTTINENCTYIQNPSFPSVYADTTSLTYTINKCSDTVCNVRLDFETFTTKGPAATTEDAAGNACAGMES